MKIIGIRRKIGSKLKRSIGIIETSAAKCIGENNQRNGVMATSENQWRKKKKKNNGAKVMK